MCIKILLPREPRHRPGATCRVVERVPQCLEDFAIDHSSPRGKGWSVTRIAFFFMAVNVEKAYAWDDRNVWRYSWKVGTLRDASKEIDPELADYVVEEEDI